MIIFIDRGTTRSNYPKLCLSDNAVSFSSLMSTAELVMQGQEIPMWLKDRGIGHHISYAKGKKKFCQGMMDFKNICNRNDYWQHLTRFALYWWPQQKQFIRYVFASALLEALQGRKAILERSRFWLYVRTCLCMRMCIYACVCLNTHHI